MTSRFRFISTHRATFGVQRLCRVLAVSRSGFYRWTASEPARQARACAEPPLPGQLHPDTATHRRIAERFAKRAFAADGPFAERRS